MRRPGVEPVTLGSRVRHANHALHHQDTLSRYTSVIHKPADAGQLVYHTVYTASKCLPGAARDDSEIVYSSAKHGNSAAAHARKVLPFSVKNELGLENYLGYQCTKFGENR